jgi:hypothetical protein
MTFMPFKNMPPLYTTWQSMRHRCLNPRFKQWNDYGGRGITICKEWDNYAQFAKDMGQKPKGYVLDRIDNNGPYAPWNCRWASWKESQRNRRVTRWVEIEGRRHKAADLAEQSGLKTDTIVYRAGLGLPLSVVLQPNKIPDRRSKEARSKPGRVIGAIRRSLTHCKHGHEFSEENTYIKPNGNRSCKKCKIIATKRYLEKRKNGI